MVLSVGKSPHLVRELHGVFDETGQICFFVQDGDLRVEFVQLVFDFVAGVRIFDQLKVALDALTARVERINHRAPIFGAFGFTVEGFGDSLIEGFGMIVRILKHIFRFRPFVKFNAVGAL
jgi:hypothetical protein